MTSFDPYEGSNVTAPAEDWSQDPAATGYGEQAETTAATAGAEDGAPLGEFIHAGSTLATGLGLMSLEIHGSVGRGGQNHPDDVEGVRARLYFLGYDPGADMDGLIQAIERYQTEVVGFHPPDGRIDAGGRTVAALAAGHQAGHDPAGHAAGTAHEPGEHHTSAVPVAGALAELVQAANNPAVNAAAALLAELEQTYRSAKHIGGGDHTAHGEMSGVVRDQLVTDVGELRQMVAGLAQAGVQPDHLEALQSAFYREMDVYTPYFYQHNNTMLEYSRERGARHDVFNTCNITSLAMCLQAMGITASSYESADALGPIVAHFHGDIDKALERTTPDLSGYRLPDVLGMAAVYENLAAKEDPTAAQLDAAGNAAMGWVPNITHLQVLASRFGVAGRVGEYHHDDLATYGSSHWSDADARGDRRRGGENVSDEGLSTADIERKVPLERYRTDIIAIVGAALNSGQQVVAGQYNHFVRIKSVDEKGVLKDDPGNWLRSNDQMTWEEARALGLFENYLILG